MKTPEPVQVIKERRDLALHTLVNGISFVKFLDIRFDRRGDELTALLPYDPKLIGNPMLPALHGGATAGFLEVSAVIQLAWQELWSEIEASQFDIERFIEGGLPRLPKTIDFSIDYLRAGLPRDAYARARVNRSGRRYASVHVEAWQDNVARPFAQATGHFLMPQPNPDDSASGG
ncbi:MAG: PaaI family thioesterase [Vannielia sp.]|uniref:PaaI family thioesterase n=1 Tax=Rhodobacterales TaxID=204455 RepID=UPI00209412E1|nr:PaaI family thioesterase [Oceanicola sp. 502str15]MCO6383610.1 PaaI family thioesterase [Oceanicola sp. 502str15]